MAKEIVPFELPELPADLEAFLEEESNVTPRGATPTLNPGGKRWTIIVNGESKTLMRADADGDEVPVQIFRGFVLAHSPTRGRTYYSSGFDPNKPGRPTCWSEDGIAPDERVPLADRPKLDNGKPASKCSACPMSVKGSQVADDGRDVKACKEHQLLAIVPAKRFDIPPLRLKLSITSIYDGKQPEREQTGWFSWSRYLDQLVKQLGEHRAHTVRVLTKIKFDPKENYPKLLFAIDRATTTDELQLLIPILKEQKESLTAMTSRLIGAGPLPPEAGSDDKDDDEDDTDEEPTPSPKPKPKPTRTAAPADDDEDTPQVLTGKAAAAAEAKARAAKDVTPPKPAKPARPPVDYDDDPVPVAMRPKPAINGKPPARVTPTDDEEDEKPPAPEGKTKAPADEPKTAAKSGSSIASIVGEWDD